MPIFAGTERVFQKKWELLFEPFRVGLLGKDFVRPHLGSLNRVVFSAGKIKVDIVGGY